MGYPANYVIIRDGRPEFFSSSGGLSVGMEMFWGPQLAEVMVRLYGSSESLSLDVGCDGGLGINFDTLEMVIFDASDLLWDVYKRDVWLRLLRAMWRGWEVRWATYGVVDLADLAGVPRHAVIHHAPDDHLWNADPLIDQMFDEYARGETFISVAGDKVRDLYLLDASWPDLLLLGPNILDRLPTSRQAPLPPECGPPLHGTRIEPESKVLTYWSCLPQSSWVFPYVQAAWPSWTVRHNDAIFKEHIEEFDGRYFPPRDEAVLADLVSELEEYDFIDYYHHAEDPAQLPALPDAEQRRAVVAAAVEEYHRV